MFALQTTGIEPRLVQHTAKPGIYTGNLNHPHHGTRDLSISLMTRYSSLFFFIYFLVSK